MRRDAVRVGVLHLMNELGARDERLRRHAAGPETIAAEQLALDERDLAAETHTTGSGHQTARASADDDDIECFGHELLPSVRRRIAQGGRRSALELGQECCTLPEC